MRPSHARISAPVPGRTATSRNGGGGGLEDDAFAARIPDHHLRPTLRVLAAARTSRAELLGPLADRGVSVETIGSATAPRGTYEAVYEGHRQARLL